MSVAIGLGQLAVAVLAPLWGLSTALAMQAAVLPLGSVYVGALSVGSVAAWYGVSRWQNGVREPIRVPTPFAAVWALWLLLTTASALRNGIDFRQLTQVLEFLFYGAIGVAAYDVMRPAGARTRVLAAVAASAWPLSAILLVTAGGDAEFVAFGRNEASFYLVLAGVVVPLAMLTGARSRRARLVAAATVAVAMSAIIAAESRASLGVGAACVGSVVLLGLWRFSWATRVLAVLAVAAGAGWVGVAAAGGSLVPTDFSTLERVSLLQQSWTLLRESPWLGQGWGSLEGALRFSLYTELTYPHPHNTYARFGAELGLLGGLLPAILYLAILRRGLQLARAGSMQGGVFCGLLGFALAALSMVDAVFYGASRAVIAMLLMAAALSFPLPTRES